MDPMMEIDSGGFFNVGSPDDSSSGGNESTPGNTSRTPGTIGGGRVAATDLGPLGGPHGHTEITYDGPPPYAPPREPGLGNGGESLIFAIMTLPVGGEGFEIEAADEAAPLAQVTLNRIAGNAFRDSLAASLRAAGRDVETEVYKSTPFGKRFIDIEVSKDGQVLGGIETKVGSSPYTSLQQLKDWWLKDALGYTVNVARDR